MDPSPPFFHHSQRYAPPPPLPQPFSGDPNFYHLPPLPPPRHHPYISPPPPYNLHPPNLHSIINHHNRDHPHSYTHPRVRVPLEEHEPVIRVRNNYSEQFSPRVVLNSNYRLNFDYRDRDLRNYNYSHVIRDNNVDLFRQDNYGPTSNLNEFSDRVNKEVSHNNSPNKQVQKKSALLRIQFNNKSKGRKNRFHPDIDSKKLDTKKLDMKKLDSKGFRNRGRVEEEREGSSMELDVSFKSNSLVAKAIDVERDLKKKRKVVNIPNTPLKKANSCVGLKEKGVKTMSCVTKHGSLKSVIVSPPPEEVDMKLNEENRDKNLFAIVSSEEDVHVDIGGTPVGKVYGKSNSSSNLSSLIGVNITTIDNSDDLSSVQNVESTYVEGMTIADNNVTYPGEINAREGHLNLSDKSSDEHVDLVSDKNELIADNNVTYPEEMNVREGRLNLTDKSSDQYIDLVSDKNQAEIAVSDNSFVDFVTETNMPVVADKEDGEIECNLVTPGTVDMFLKEVSESIPTASNNPPKDHISREQHIVDSGTETDSSSSLSVDSSDNDFSSEMTNSSHKTITKYGKKVKVSASVSSSPILFQEEDASVDSVAFNSGAELPANIDKEWPQSEDRDEGLNFDKSSVISSPSSDGAEDLIEDSLLVETETKGNGKEYDAIKEQGILFTVPLQNRNSASEMECDDYLLGKNSLPLVPTDLSLCTNDKSTPLNVSDSGSQETMSVSVESQMLKTKTEIGQISEEMEWEVLLNQEKKPSVGGPSAAYPLTILQNTSNIENSGHAMGAVNAVNPRIVSLNRVGVKASKNPLQAAVPRNFRLNSSVAKTPQPNQNLKPSTWQQNSSPSPPIPVKPTYPSSVYRRAPLPTLTGKVPKVAYVRQGNSLVRKTPPTSATPKAHVLSSSNSWLNPSVLDEAKNLTGNYSNANFSSFQSSSRTEPNATVERPNTPPLLCSTKVSNYINPSSDTELETLKLDQNMDLLQASNSISEISANENIAGQIDSMESNAIVKEIMVPTNMGKVVYVKRKVNQLVAASKIEDTSSVGYFKRRGNQLVRKPLDNMQKLDLNSQEKRASQIIASNFQKRYGRGFRKICKPTRFSRVWTLRNAESMKKDTSLLSHLFPWKRATQQRRFTYNQTSVSNNGTSSQISRKLLLSRQQKTIYKRSFHGLSLKISKVLSVDGFGLKWSKSLNKNCKQANEEATLAVAAVEREKRDKDVITARTKSTNHFPRKLVHILELHSWERVVRVGSVRYKMDPTRRTLQRISDEESACSFAVQSGKTEKKCSVPRRLVIGNREYVRIGNGNLLIQDPKKRTRMLASEKVRWSLHTARLSLARKKTYCQFFTRFGKCEKGGGKCPYIHDPEKIAVCTKFLFGSCSDSNCKLTHKVIPERMPDCSYFLQGLCSNETCPYRHVNVNPNASVCEGFLRGYCADGNECRKKHSYVCPIFESTGTCPQSSNCKLHHPKKNQIKGKKREHRKGKNNFRGRYFGLEHISVSDTKIAVSSKTSTKDDDDMFFQEGNFADFIPLDVSDEEEEGGEPFDSSLEQKSCSNDSQPIEVDVDNLIKPVGIMKRKVMKDASPTV